MTDTNTNSSDRDPMGTIEDEQVRNNEDIEAQELDDFSEDEDVAEANAFSQLSGHVDPAKATVTQPISLAALSQNVVSTHSPGCSKATTIEERRAQRKEMKARKLEELWIMNFKEAAIHLEEGENGDDFTTIPTNRAKMVFYFMANNRYFNMVLLVASIVYMILSLFEGPGVPMYTITREIHMGVEAACLFFFILEQFVKLQWLGRYYFRNKSLVIKTFILSILLVEVVVFHVRGFHILTIRVVRAFRPYFLLDNRYMRGARDFVRLFFLSLGPVVEMVMLLLFNMLLFAVFGYYLFAAIPNYFETIQRSFLNLFILLTTANFPDVMMPAYAVHPAYCLFFIGYLLIELYLLMNLLFAVVYNKFNESQLSNIKKLFRHRRQAAQLAFKLLTTKKEPDSITIQQFEGFMQYFRPRMSRLDIYLTFKALDDNSGGTIGLTEFYNVYESSRYKWKREAGKQVPWWYNKQGGCNKFMRSLFYISSSRLCKVIVYSAIVANTVIVLRETSRNASVVVESVPTMVHDWYQIVFSTLYVLDILMKVLCMGPTAYFSNSWQVFDLITTSCIIAGQIIDYAWKAFPYAVFLMPLRLIRFIKLRKLYRQVISTTFSLLGRFRSVIIVVICIYYAYGIIGIELFGHLSMKYCCVGNAVAELMYLNDSVSGTNQVSYHYNNFQNMRNAMVTLFELTVVNNWFVMMEAFTFATHQKAGPQIFEWARVYFMFFYIVMMIVMNMVLSFVVGAFMFQMQYTTREVGDAIADSEWVYEKVKINESERELCQIPLRVPLKKLHLKALRRYSTATKPNVSLQLRKVTRDQDSNSVVYLGKRRKRQFEFDLELHETELKEWLLTENVLDTQRSIDHEQSDSNGGQHRPHNASFDLPAFWRCRYWRRFFRRLRKKISSLLLWFIDLDAEKKQFLYGDPNQPVDSDFVSPLSPEDQQPQVQEQQGQGLGEQLEQEQDILMVEELEDCEDNEIPHDCESNGEEPAAQLIFDQEQDSVHSATLCKDADDELESDD